MEIGTYQSVPQTYSSMSLFLFHTQSQHYLHGETSKANTLSLSLLPTHTFSIALVHMPGEVSAFGARHWGRKGFSKRRRGCVPLGPPWLGNVRSHLLCSESNCILQFRVSDFCILLTFSAALGIPPNRHYYWDNTLTTTSISNSIILLQLPLLYFETFNL